MSLWSRVRNVFRGEQLSGEIDEELQAHIEQAVEQGRAPEEARRSFGPMLLQRERSRDIRAMAWMEAPKPGLKSCPWWLAEQPAQSR